MTTFGIANYPDQRTSKTRNYTHAVVGSFDGTKLYERLREGDTRQAIKDYAYHVDCHKHGADTTAHCLEVVAHPESCYIARRLEHLRGRCESLTSSGVLQWSQSEANARKACNSWASRYYENLCVVPVHVLR